MNRIKSLLRSSVSSLESISESSSARKGKGKYKAAKQTPQASPLSLSFPHRYFSPEHYEPRYDYPLVIWLHSDASSELEIANIMPALSLRNYVALGIRGSHANRKQARRFDWSLRADGVAVAEECIFEAIEVLNESVSINPSRVFLAGFGNGGSMAQLIGLRHPDRFAGVVSINGKFPNLPRSLSRWKEAKSLPILWMHGCESTKCGMDSMSDMLEAVYPAALQVFPVQFPCGDELDTNMLNKANRFMMQIVTNEPICVHETQVS